nr:VENN motif pre-toxin domain-containing protein [Limnobaculum eriocheiris]
MADENFPIDEEHPNNANLFAKVIGHAIVGLAVAEGSGNNGLSGALGAASGELIAKTIAEEYFETDPKKLTEAQRQFIANMTSIATGVAAGLVADNTADVGTAALAAYNAAVNNSISVDNTRESVKESAQYWKGQVREKLGENTASQLANGLIILASEAGDLALAGGDTVFDAIAALATCATGGGYCSQAQSDLAKKDAAAANILNTIMNGDAWEGIKATAIKAANGDQKALESVAGILSGALIPTKAMSGGGSPSKIVVKPVELKGGAGGSWNVLDEVINPNVVKQESPTACGAACGEMMLKDRGIFTSQVELGTELTSMNSLANKLNKVDSGWVGNPVDVSSFSALNQTGSWSAMMWDSGNKVGHWVVVKGTDEIGNVLIHDPFKGTSYTMTVKDFKDVWNGHSVYKP